MARKIDLTLSFYKNKLPYKAKQFNHIFPLDSYIGEMIEDKKEVWIADLGAGMFSTTGSTWPNTKVHLYPSDILADQYNDYLKESSVIPVIVVEKQDMEKLTYKDNSFDIILCINALDHCENPAKAVQEMDRICKPGGWIYLKHVIDNAEGRRYSGLHQWNISDEGVLWNNNVKIPLYGFDITILKQDNMVVMKRRKP